MASTIATRDRRSVLAVIPVKPFGVAKARLAPVLDAGSRSILGKAIAVHTAAAAAAAGALTAIVTGDPGVAAWAGDLGHAVIEEAPEPGGLDDAARTAAHEASRRGMRWAIVHADLPLVTERDLAVMFTAPGVAISPSYDGGTTVLVGDDPSFPFSYGPASFHRHLSAAPDARVVNRPGLALDLDTPEDLTRVRASTAGAWLASLAI